MQGMLKLVGVDIEGKGRVFAIGKQVGFKKYRSTELSNKLKMRNQFQKRVSTASGVSTNFHGKNIQKF